MSESSRVPSGELAVRTLAMPSHVNVNGDIFGGWVVSQMDLAGSSVAYKRSKSRVTTAAIEAMSFVAPVRVGDFVCCYADVLSVGTSSMRINIETWAIDTQTDERRLVTEGIFTFVAIDKQGRPHPVD